MTVLMKRLALLTVALFVSAGCCVAAPPNGVVTFQFSTNDTAVYDLTGSFQFDDTMIGAHQSELGLSYGINVTQDARGFLTGSGLTAVAVGNDFVAAEYTARGKISTSHGLRHVSLTVRLKGQDVIGGVFTPFSISVTYSLDIAPESGTMEGTARGSGKFGRLGSTRIHSDISVPLPGGTDGSWTLQMNIVSFSRLGGTASVILSNGRTLILNLSGSYSSSQDRSTVHLSGFGDSRGNSGTVKFDSDLNLLELRAKLFGQSVVSSNPSD